MYQLGCAGNLLAYSPLSLSAGGLQVYIKQKVQTAMQSAPSKSYAWTITWPSQSEWCQGTIEQSAIRQLRCRSTERVFVFATPAAPQPAGRTL